MNKEMKKEVEKFIDNNFNIEDFKIKDMKIFPAGKVLTDKNGNSILIFYDIQKEKIVYEVI